MAHSVTIRGEAAIAGAGKDANGNPVQGKKWVWGVILVTAYATNGEAVSPRDFNLSAVDLLMTEVSDVNTSTFQTAAAGLAAFYDRSNNKLIINKDVDAGTELDNNTGTATVRFVAFGDTAENSDLS